MIPSKFPWDTADPADTADNPVIIASRIRLARNLRTFPFPCNASPAQKLKVLDLVRNALADSKDAWTETDAGTAPDSDLELLEENLTIPPGFRKDRTGKALFLSGDGTTGILVNTEDHIRLQTFAPGLKLKKLREKLDELDNFLAERLPFSYHTRFGYLTASPADAGTGLKASILLHLPALPLTGGNKFLQKAAEAMDLTIRGFFGEKIKITGNLYRIANRSTMGESEPEITGRITECASRIGAQELNARKILRENHSIRLMDFCARAASILASARLISTEEAMNALSGMRLAIETDLKQPPHPFDWNKLLLAIQPCHVAPAPCTPEKRAEKRASFLRSVFGGDPLPDTATTGDGKESGEA